MVAFPFLFEGPLLLNAVVRHIAQLPLGTYHGASSHIIGFVGGYLEVQGVKSNQTGVR